MIMGLRTIGSLSNLGKKGQIATVLILIMVAILIFILVTVNLGQTSLTATNLANAADSGALLLGSQLVTRAYVYQLQLGGVEQCVYGGLASTIFGIIGAIIGLVIGFIVPWLSPFIGALLGGLFGGAFGGAYAHTGVLQGAIQGALIGAAIGAGVNAGLAIGEAAATSLEGLGLAAYAGTISPSLAAYLAAMAVYAAVGLGIALPSASAIYNQYVADQMTEGALEVAARKLKSLPTRDQYRENVFLQVLAQTIDDPNVTVDVYDSDEDGITDEEVPYFQYWWDRRVASFNVPELHSLIQDFIDGPVSRFLELEVPGPLSREELYGVDGWIVELARGLEHFGYDIGFWKPGTPSPDPEEDFHDEVNALDWRLQQVQADLNTLVEISQSSGGLENLAKEWKLWMILFYDPNIDPDTGEESDGDYYDILEELVYGDEDLEGLVGWKAEIEEIRDSLPLCIEQLDPVCVEACDRDCQQKCEDICEGDCEEKCEATCTQDCDSSCAVECSSVCAGNEPPECMEACMSGCLEVYTGICQQECDDFCAGDPEPLVCMETCMSGCIENYRGICQGHCNSACAETEPPECMEACMSGCNDACLPDCQQDCISICEGDCLSSCKESCVEDCEENCEVVGYSNPPCKSSVDRDMDDEFSESLTAIDNLTTEIEAFRSACADCYAQMEAASVGVEGGANPVTYTWVDSRGEHSITAETGNFQIASIILHKSGNWLKKKQCLYVLNWFDNGTNCWVSVTRKDPANKDTGILGPWNRSSEDEITTSKISRVSYNALGLMRYSGDDGTYGYFPEKMRFIKTTGTK